MLVMHRHALTDAQWARLEPLLPRQVSGPKAARGDRLFIEAVIFRARTGLPWRDLPERFGPWKSVYNRFANWARRGHWAAIFRELQLEIDDTGSIVDVSVEVFFHKLKCFRAIATRYEKPPGQPLVQD
jgi:transposase